MPSMTDNPEQTAEQSLTHHVRLVLDNDHGSYLMRREIVQDFMKSDDAQYPHRLGERLRDWAGKLAGLESERRLADTEAGELLAREILSTGLAWVDWDTIARDWIEEEQES